MGYPPPPPPGAPGPQQPGYGAPPPGAYPPQPQTGGYAPQPQPGYAGGPPPGYAPGPPPASGSGGGGGNNKPLILLMAGLVAVVLLVVVGALVLVLSGGEDTVELTQAQREDALLTDGDIGEGYVTSDEEDDPTDTSDEDDEPDASQECLDVLDRLEEEQGEAFFDSGDEEEPDDSVSRTFTDDAGSTVEHSVGVDDGVIDTYRDVVAACDEVRFEDETGASAVRFTEGPDIEGVDYVLDVEFDFTAPDDGGSITYGGRIALWSVKGNAAFVLVTDGFEYSDDPAELPTAVDFDEGFFEDIVATADDKLREVIDEA